jgi:phosphate transport system substrate-binding protein
VNTSSLRRIALPAVAALTVGLTLTACGDKNDSGSGSGGGTLSGGGATSQANAETTWRADYQKANGGTINYEEVGSGTGVENFSSGAYSFAGTDAYLTSDQLSAAKDQCGADPIEVPAYVSPIAVAFNLPGVKTLNLDAKTISDIFAGKITKWNDTAIASQNSGAKLPSSAITPVHRSDDSGTTQNFTDYLSKASTSWPYPPAQTWPVKGGEAAEGTSGVIAAIKAGEGSVGYADHSQVGDLGSAALKVGSAYVPPSAEAAAKVAELSTPTAGRPAGDLSIDVARDTTEAGAYPLILISYQIVCQTYDKASDADLVKAFETYVVSAEGQDAAAQAAGSAPLSDALREKVLASIAMIKGA